MSSPRVFCLQQKRHGVFSTLHARECLMLEGRVPALYKKEKRGNNWEQIGEVEITPHVQLWKVLA